MHKSKRKKLNGEVRAPNRRRKLRLDQQLDVVHRLEMIPLQRARTGARTWIRPNLWKSSSNSEEKSDVEMRCTRKSSRKSKKNLVLF